MAVHCIVPARLGSLRFPGKPLAKICGKEMVVRTLERARQAECFDRIVCATDNQRIADVVSAAGFDYVLTGPAATGSDRVAQAAKQLDLDLVVNLQGDEPLVEPLLLAEVARTLEAHPDEWVSVACPLSLADAMAKTVVKVRLQGDYAVDFTREVLPGEVDRWFQHQGIYAYSGQSRDEFSSLPQCQIELERSLEQMRIMGRRPIRMVRSNYPSVSVDVPSDLVAVENLLSQQK